MGTRKVPRFASMKDKEVRSSRKSCDLRLWEVVKNVEVGGGEHAVGNSKEQ